MLKDLKKKSYSYFCQQLKLVSVYNITMEKLKKCRICLAENVRMIVVANNLQDIYERLTNVPFVTEDNRPMLACLFCCSKLKQCYQLQKKCLEAEELFAQMLNYVYETKPLNPGMLEFRSGFNITPTVHEHEELPAVFQGLPNIIEPKKEPQTDELELESIGNSCREVTIIPPRHSESDLEDDLPLMEFKIEIEEEQEVSKSKLRARETTSTVTGDDGGVCERRDDLIKPKEEHQSDELKPLDFENIFLDVEDISPHHSETDLEDDVPLTELKTEVEEAQELSKNKRRTRETTRATIGNKPKLEDATTAEQTKKEKSDSKVIQMIQKSTSKPGTCFKELYKCEQRSFKPVKKKIQHTRTQIGETPYKCDVCQRSFSKTSALTKHNRIHTGEKPYKCELCQRSFIEKSALTNHIRVHTGEKPFKCHICQCSFRRTGTLKTHIRHHTGEKAFKCDFCEQSFIQKSTLTNHIRTHTGEKPFKCDICQCSFRQNSHLTTHIRQHTGEKPYKCDVCQRSFNQKWDLTKHNRIHTGEKPYECGACQRSFSQKSALTKHIRIHTGEKPYECGVCKLSFREKRALTKHIC